MKKISVVITGFAGAGKTTVAETIRRALEAKGVDVIANFGEHEPAELVTRKGDEADVLLKGVDVNIDLRDIQVSIDEVQTRSNPGLLLVPENEKCRCQELTKTWRAEDRAVLCGHVKECPRFKDNFG